MSALPAKPLRELEAGRGHDQFPLRFPDGLRAEIKATARANGRSMNAEILARLQRDSVDERLDRIEAMLRNLCEGEP